jgi:lipid II:glycine glycyltransferase (peptidoglycan interpeptide bridge formation enzyme)
MIARHEENKRDKAFSAVDDRFLRVLRDASGEDFTILQAIHQDRAVAGISVIRYGLGAEYFVAWFGPDGRAVNAGNYLLWQAIRHMKSQGVATLDLGGLDPNTGYSTFKRGLRPREYTLIGECLTLL